MSNKERALQLIKSIPEEKMAFVVSMLETMQGYAGESIEPDEWDLELIAQAERENDGTTITLEALAEELGIEL